jgi:predicted RNase H-like HicB family nuclease
MAKYIAVVHYEKGSYGVAFPDFPGCISAGDDIQHTRDMAQEALALHIEGMLEDGDPIPAPSTYEQIQAGELAEGADCFISVELEVPDRRMTRVNVILPAETLAAIDAEVKRRRISRSGFFVRLASDHLKKRKKLQAKNQSAA